jgi:hypothetical protein
MDIPCHSPCLIDSWDVRRDRRRVGAVGPHASSHDRRVVTSKLSKSESLHVCCWSALEVAQEMLEMARINLSCCDRGRRTSADAAVCVADTFRHRWFSALRSTYARNSWRTGFKRSGASEAGTHSHWNVPV